MEDQLIKVPEVPPMPPMPTEPKKKMGKGKIALIVVGGLIVLGAVTSSEPDAKPSTAGTACIDVEAASSAAQDASTELSLASVAADSADVSGMADHSRNAADDWTQVAILTEDYPAISQPSADAAGHLNAAAEALDNFQLEQALTYVNMANDDVNAATAALRSSSANPC